MRLGPEGPGDGSFVGEIAVRRYRCLRCSAVIMVVPRGVKRRLRYGAFAIALALALWAAEGYAAREVRGCVSPFRVVGEDAARDWHSLRRWARGSPWSLDPPPELPPKARALRLVQWLAGHAFETDSLTAMAWEGALRA